MLILQFVQLYLAFLLSLCILMSPMQKVNITEMFSRIFQREVVQILGLYCFLALVYYIALVFDTGWYYHFKGVALNYLLKALITIPIWWLLFRKLADLPFWKKLLIHLILFPLFALSWLYLFYILCDQLDIRRARGSRIVWEFYITVLFYVIQFGVFHLSDYYKKLKEQQLLATQLSRLNLQIELSALKAQLNPHFLYNVFNTINAAIPTSAKNARDMVNKLSDLFRYQLKASKEELVPLKDELVFVEKYLDLEKERFGDRLRFNIHAEEALLNAKIPPLLIQPIIENSIKHGISPLIEGGAITLRIHQREEAIEVVIADTGTGIEGQQKSELLKQGIGLSNTDERLAKMYGNGIELNDNSPRGLIVKFSLPINPKTNSL